MALLNVKEIKEKVDTLIGTRVSFSLLSLKGIPETFSEIVDYNKIIEGKDICLTYFKDSKFCINSNNLLEDKLFQVIKEEKKEVAI